jgi:hypothetical protein
VTSGSGLHHHQTLQGASQKLPDGVLVSQTIDKTVVLELQVLIM